MAWFAVSLVFIIFIGFRYQVGGDWFSYEGIFHVSSRFAFHEALTHVDPGYTVLNWLVARAGFDIVLVNIVCAVFFTWGLVTFARSQPRSWLALTVAVPYLVTVVAMGYSRQSVAIGFAMLAFTALSEKSAIKFSMWAALAALFHQSAILIIPFAILAKTRGRAWTAVWIGAVGALLFYLLLAKNFNQLVVNYIDTQYQSQGAAIRVSMNALPAVIFLVFRKHFGLFADELRLWTYLSICAIGLVILLFVSPSSTAVDRIALYFIPLQVFVLCRLPSACYSRFGVGEIVTVGVVAYSALVLFIWLNFAHHAGKWLPYRMSLFAG